MNEVERRRIGRILSGLLGVLVIALIEALFDAFDLLPEDAVWGTILLLAGAIGVIGYVLYRLR